MKKIKLAGAIVETVLSIPIVGWFGYIYSFGIFGIAEVSLGIIGLSKHKKKTGSILQIIAGCLGWLPIIGLTLHILSAVFLYKEVGK